jgi:hypothetical protein
MRVLSPIFEATNDSALWDILVVDVPSHFGMYGNRAAMKCAIRTRPSASGAAHMFPHGWFSMRR